MGSKPFLLTVLCAAGLMASCASQPRVESRAEPEATPPTAFPSYGEAEQAVWAILERHGALEQDFIAWAEFQGGIEDAESGGRRADMRFTLWCADEDERALPALARIAEDLRGLPPVTRLDVGPLTAYHKGTGKAQPFFLSARLE